MSADVKKLHQFVRLYVNGLVEGMSPGDRAKLLSRDPKTAQHLASLLDIQFGHGKELAVLVIEEMRSRCDPKMLAIADEMMELTRSE